MDTFVGFFVLGANSGTCHISYQKKKKRKILEVKRLKTKIYMLRDTTNESSEDIFWIWSTINLT